MRAAFILAVLALFALSPSAACAPPDAIPAIIGVSVSLDQETQVAHVTEQSPGIVTFTGQFSVDKLPVQRAVVTLDSRVDTGWVSNVSPSTAVFTSTTPQSLTVTVVVPQKTLSTVTGTLIVHATMNAGGQTAEDTDNATITVEQYYMLNLTSENPFFETDKPGVSATYKVLVANRGNGPDSFALEISNLKELVSWRWAVALDKEATPPIQPGLNSEVVVTVTSAKDASVFEAMTRALVLKASSVGASANYQNISLSLHLYYHQKAIDPVFDVTVPIIIVAVAVASVAVVIWRWRKSRARKAQAAPGPDEPIGVEPD